MQPYLYRQFLDFWLSENDCGHCPLMIDLDSVKAVMNLFDRFVAAFFACMEVSMNVFEAIRENGITARQAAEHCGIKINRSGMAVCPFHKDKNPSMKIDSRYYCFGCGEKGDAIDFVAKFYGLGKKEAALRIASDFGISFEDNRGRKPPPKRKRRLSPEQRFERAEKRCFRVISDYLCCLRQWKEQYAPQEPDGEWNPLFCEALEKKDYIEYLLDVLLYAPLSERVQLVADYGEEVLKIERRLEQCAAGAEGGAGKDNGENGAGVTAGNMV